ncbi:MAG: DUF4326 domain-containing protein [Treponema sp.]|nr:DUF4326 domain-containing protein [Treponema sp.]
MPKRIQRKRTKGWKMPENAVYVGRPTKWGNPFTGDDAVEKYKEAISEWPIKDKTMDEWFLVGGKGSLDMLINLAGRNISSLNEIPRKGRNVLNELKGKDLACWCPLTNKDGTPYNCHADILLEIVNK